VGELRTAFWNVSNLFEPGTCHRGPRTVAELDAKVEVVASVARSLFGGEGPDLLGLAEVGTERITDAIRSRLDGEYVAAWVGPGMDDETGLGILARASVVAQVKLVAQYRPRMMARPRAAILRCTLRSASEPFLLAINHWKSRAAQRGTDDGADRIETARWLGSHLATSPRVTCVLVFGDFNAEPFEPPFSETGLRGVRFFSSALWARATPAYVYNTAWRFLCEPDYWEEARRPGYQEPRPKTTHDSLPPVVFDQLLVSGRALRGGVLTLRERTVRYHCDEITATRVPGTGRLHPARWQYDEATGFSSGASDHFPLVAVFDVTGGEQR